MSSSRYQWRLPVRWEPTGTAYPPLLAQLMHNRGLTEPDRQELFLNPDRRLLADPFLLPDMELAVARTYRALLSGESIAVYGDFDADGISGTAVVVEGLAALGANVIPYMPHRVNEGYGLKVAALQSLRNKGVSLTITVDCGVTANEEIAQARGLGMDIIVTDHHSVPETLPPALAVVDARRDGCRYPADSCELAGAGVAFKFVQGLYKMLGREEDLEGLLQLVVLGTVSDLVPLVGENRYLVKRGLDLLNANPRVGVQELMRVAGLKPGSLDANSVLWSIGPRLNAAGRVAHPIVSYDLLTTTSQEQAATLATDLEQKNSERQKLMAGAFKSAREQVLAAGLEDPVIIVSGDDYPPGVIGLVASRLVDEFSRPAVVLEKGPEVSRGSARSISCFNVIEALGECHDLLSRFGGHPMASGFSLANCNIDTFTRKLVEIAREKMAGVDLRPSIDIDAEVKLSQVNSRVYQMIRMLEPCGKGNPEPVFLSRHCRVIESRTVGATGDHLKLRVQGDGGQTWWAIAFGMGSRLSEVHPLIDMVYTVGIDKWNGNEVLQIVVQDFAMSAT